MYLECNIPSGKLFGEFNEPVKFLKQINQTLCIVLTKVRDCSEIWSQIIEQPLHLNISTALFSKPAA